MQTGLAGVFDRHVQQCELFGHDRLAYRNIGGHDTLVVNHSVAVSSALKGRKTTRSAIRWYELRGTGGNFSVYQQEPSRPTTLTAGWAARRSTASSSRTATNPSVRFVEKAARY